MVYQNDPTFQKEFMDLTTKQQEELKRIGVQM